MCSSDLGILRPQSERGAVFGDGFGGQTCAQQRVGEGLAQGDVLRGKPHCFSQLADVIGFRCS